MRQIWIDENTDFVDEDDPPEYHIDTGGVRFEDDWPGFFMRGDDALYVAALISGIYATHDMEQVHGLQQLKMYADQIFDEVPYKQWVDERGHSILQAVTEEDGHILADEVEIAVQRDGTVTRKEEVENGGEEDKPDV